MTIDEALDRFVVVDEAADASGIDLLRDFAEDAGPGYLTGDDEQVYEHALASGVQRPFANSIGSSIIPGMLAEFLNEHLVATFDGEPEQAHSIAATMGRLVEWLADVGAIHRQAARAGAGVAKRAADQLPRAMVLGVLLDRQAARVDQKLGFDPAEVVDGFQRIDRLQPGMLWFADGIGPVPIGEAASRVAQVGWWIDITVAPKGGFWHILEVGAVVPERTLPPEPRGRSGGAIEGPE